LLTEERCSPWIGEDRCRSPSLLSWLPSLVAPLGGVSTLLEPACGGEAEV
jgi:hypothetical protein